MITRQLKVEIDREQVLRQIDCYKESDLYEEVAQEYEEILEEMYSLCEPVFLMEKGEVGPELAREDLPEGTPVLFVISSIGKGISEYSTRAFAMGDYLKGMLSDAMADSALFSLEKEFAPLLKDACANYQMGIKKRLEAPHDIPMEAQRIVWEKTNAYNLCGIGISTGYMLDPVKSNAVIYVLTDEPEVFRHQHDCRNCDRFDCKLRNIPDIPVKVIDDKKTFLINIKEKQSILEALNTVDASFGAVCGGAGKCGKCKIQLLKGYLPKTEADSACFTKEELDMGMRLSCRAFPTEPLEISLKFQGEESFQILAGDTEPVNRNNEELQDFGIAVDIGTTTIAMQLISLKTGRCHAVQTGLNHQRRYGADVIARIKASTEGKAEALRNSIRVDLQDGFKELIKKAGVLPEDVKEVVIAGNTTMGHLLMGYPCESLGVFPFTPVNIHSIQADYEAVFDTKFLSAQVRLLPGISAFVGADITAGIYECEMHRTKEYTLFIDLGTNGEIVLGNAEKMLATSTAAGPAFEGGNILWGVGSIEGAICSAKDVNGEMKIQTIGDKFPVGICGTGVLELIAELTKAEIIDETGCLAEEYFEDGYPVAVTTSGETITLTQKDVREVQLAKAAVRAGIETLLLRYGIEKEQVSRVFIAGGFGVRVDCKKAIEIGMFAKEFHEKIKAVGNTSLSGAVKALRQKKWEEIEKLAEGVKEINLSADKDFNRFYMDCMYFEEE